MNDPEAIRFCNEVIRPLCEQARAMRVRIDALRVAWFSGIDAKFGKSDELVEDGREMEGISKLTCGDVTNSVAQLIKTADQEASAWDVSILQKPCVRQIPSIT